MQVELHVVQGGRDSSTIVDAESFPVTGDAFLIGRDEVCHLRLNSRLISRRHCVLLQDEYAVRIRDLCSSNGTFVNGRKTDSYVDLNDGDIIVVGELFLRITISR